MSPPNSLFRIPELDRLIDEKLTAIAACLGRERCMGDYQGLAEGQQESLLDDAFEMVADWENAAQTAKEPARQGELQRLLHEHHQLTQEMSAIHREVDRQDHETN